MIPLKNKVKEREKEKKTKKVKKESRNYAKRQLTWFRRERDVIWVSKNEHNYDEDKILNVMLDHIQERIQLCIKN